MGGQKTRNTDEQMDWAMSALQSPRTCELLLKAHYKGGCERGHACPIVTSLLRRMKQLRAT